MSKPSWDALTEQLRDDPDPKSRRKVCALLAATRDPAVIPFLKNAYMSDEDERVRNAARDALAMFKGMAEGKDIRRLPIGDRVLSMVLAGLVVVFVASLGIRLIGSIGDGDDDSEPIVDNSWNLATPTNRQDLERHIQDRLTQARQLSDQLRIEIQNFNATGHVACPLSYIVPDAALLSEKDNYTYPDLKVIGASLDASRITLEKALIFLRGACIDPSTQMEKVLQASTELDNADSQLNKVATLLQEAIAHPAPTVGPTVTPLPTLTFTPSPTNTPAPISATPLPSATEPATITPEFTATTVPPTLTPIPTVTLTPLPLPGFDYPALLSEMAKVYPVVMGDLKNNYSTGMIDQWKKAAEIGQENANYCTLQVWPAAFALSADQVTVLQGGEFADQQLVDAVRLQTEGVMMALEARTLFEQTCSNLALAGSSAEGLELAQGALDLLMQSQVLYDEIRKRDK